MKRVFIVHGWASRPGDCWFPSTKKALEKKGFKVFALRMPNPDVPRVKPWVGALKTAVGKPDEDTYFIGHSIGCQTIMRYIQDLRTPVGGAVFVGGWFTLKGLDGPDDLRIARPWLTGARIASVKKNARHIVTLLSTNDPFVPLNASKTRFKKIGKVIVQKNKGHYNTESEISSLPEVVQELMRMSR